LVGVAFGRSPSCAKLFFKRLSSLETAQLRGADLTQEEREASQRDLVSYVLGEGENGHNLCTGCPRSKPEAEVKELRSFLWEPEP
jgi:hypothetical protein